MNVARAKGAGEPDHYLIQRVRDGLAKDPSVAELDLHVRLLGKRLIVSGNVSTAERRAAVATAAERLAPGYEVHNDTVIPTRVEVDQNEELS
jgi:hypothetical protein